jgi:hypothetical protein
MKFLKIAKSIIDLRNADVKCRGKLIDEGKLSEGYHEGMEKLHIQNAEFLDKIMDEIGYPTIEKVGLEASESAWLIIQHSISRPEFMKKCLKLLERVHFENSAEAIKIAYLTDRIAVFEDKPQLYGTQFDWDKNENLSPNLYDDLTKVNERRKSIGLNSLEEQLEIIRNQVKKENQKPPKDFEKRKQDIEEWKINVGWTK